MSEIMQGLSISVIGLLITFFALGVFILLMIVLQRLFPPKTDTVEEPAQPVVQIELAQASTELDEEGEVAAAIAAAVSYYQAAGRSSLGSNLESGRGRWWGSGRSSNGRPSRLQR